MSIMQDYNIFTSFKTDLDQWMKARFLEPILSIEGGWEYWLQIDFPAWLDVTKQNQYDFRREVSGVVEGSRLDWLLNSQVTGSTPTAVEIKAQTHKYLNTTFISNVKTDVDKLSTLGDKYNKLMLAAVIDQKLYDEFEKNTNFELLLNQGTVAFFAWAKRAS